MDRKWLLGLSGAALVVLILAIVVVFAGQGGGGPDGAARAFFAAIPSGGPQAAYGKAAPAFRSATTPDAWAATAAQYNLAQYSSSSWSGADKGGDVVTLNGVLNLKGGGVQPAVIQMVKGAGGWSVYSLNLQSGGVNGSTVQTATGGGASAPPGLGDSTAPPIAPSGAAPGLGASAGNPASTSPSDAGAAPPTGASPSGYAAMGAAPGPSSGAPPVTLIRTRISHDCGPKLLQMPGVETIDVHCVDPMAAVPGTRGSCQAIINGGRPVNVSVIVQSYDPARDDAELDCRLY